MFVHQTQQELIIQQPELGPKSHILARESKPTKKNVTENKINTRMSKESKSRGRLILQLMRNTFKIIGGKEVSSQITWNFSVKNYEKKKISFQRKKFILKKSFNALRLENAKMREEIKSKSAQVSCKPIIRTIGLCLKHSLQVSFLKNASFYRLEHPK